MSANAEDVSGQSPTPSNGNPEGADLKTAQTAIEGLLDDDGHFNPDGGMSRAHPDYVEDDDPRAQQPERDERGRFKKADATQADDTGDEDESLDIPAGDDLTEDTEQQQAAGDTDEDPAESADPEAQAEDQDTDAIQTLAEFADALEVSVDELKEAVTHSFNAAGEEVTVTLAELEAGYQKDADYRRSTAKLAQDRQFAEDAFRERHQQYEAQNHFLNSQFTLAEQIVAAELEDPRLAQLRESDPAEWTARRDEIGQRLQHLRNGRMEAAQAYQGFVNANLTRLRADEEKALMEHVPDYGSSHKAKAKEVLTAFGYSPVEISNIFDHRIIRGVLELSDLRAEVAELRKLKEQAQDTVKRVKKDVPKITKPGKQRRAGGGIKRDNLAKLRDRARKSGKVDDAAKVIEQLI